MSQTSFDSTTPVTVGAFEGDRFVLSCMIGYYYEGDGVCICSTGGVWVGSCSCSGK